MQIIMHWILFIDFFLAVCYKIAKVNYNIAVHRTPGKLPTVFYNLFIEKASYVGILNVKVMFHVLFLLQFFKLNFASSSNKKKSKNVIIYKNL